MLDRLLELGTVFDWISPCLAYIHDALNGPSHTFLIPEDCGWSGKQIEALLRANGVRVWGLMVVNRTIMATVRLAQARWAQYLLDREGIPVETPYRDASRVRRRARREPAADRAARWLDDLAEKIGF